jgi:hypothetical protein
MPDMSLSRTTVLLVAGCSIALAVAANAQTKKSTPVTNIGEGEAVMVSSKTGTVHKSNSKVSAAKHQAAMGKGAREISRNTVIYRQGGKMYMYDYQDEANTDAAENFQTHFDNE